MSDASIAAIEFALSTECDSKINFLRCWSTGEFDTIRKEWPEAPEAIFIGTDPLHKKTLSSDDLVIGKAYNWINQHERLIYIGIETDATGVWYQFGRTVDPEVVWCDVTESNLAMLEETINDRK